MAKQSDEGRVPNAEPGKKTHLSALVLIPPESVWEPIQRIRRLHDPGFHRWMPHITLLYPFVPHQWLNRAADKVREVAAIHPEPEIALSEFRFFNHQSGRVTLWLAPEPPDRIVRLHEAFYEVFPECDDTARHQGGYAPHLSVGAFRARHVAQIVRNEAEAQWEPIRVKLTHVAILARSGYEKDPFRVVASAPIGARV